MIYTVVGLYNLHALAGRRVNAALELHIRSRHFLVHIEEFTPEPLHVFIRQLLLLI